jgi:hypothetical protein
MTRTPRARHDAVVDDDDGASGVQGRPEFRWVLRGEMMVMRSLFGGSRKHAVPQDARGGRSL